MLTDALTRVANALKGRGRRGDLPPMWAAHVRIPTADRPFAVVYYRDEEGWYVGEAPELPGCVSQARTLDAFLANIAEAIEGCREVRLANGLPEREALVEPAPILA